MRPESLLQLLALALIDSTSIGTLVIPVWLLLRHDARRLTGKIGLYLAVIGVFYFLVGAVMLTSAQAVSAAWGEGTAGFAASRPAHWLALAVGATLLWFGLRDLLPSAASSRTARRPVPTAAGGTTPAGHDGGVPPDAPAGTPAAARARVTGERWGTRISKALMSPGGLVALALTAGLLELPTMLPYVAAIGVLTVQGPGGVAALGWLGLYCLVMLLPATLMLAVRLLFARAVDAPLQRFGAWLGRASGETVLWIAAIAGFLLVRYALPGL